MKNLFPVIFISMGIVFVLVAVYRVESKVDKLHSKVDAIAMFLNLDSNSDKEEIK